MAQMVMVLLGAGADHELSMPRIDAIPRRCRLVGTRSPRVSGGCWHHAAVRTLVLVIFIFNITFGAAWSVLVLYATQRLGMGEVGFGLITTVGALGGLLSRSPTAGSTRHVYPRDAHGALPRARDPHPSWAGRQHRALPWRIAILLVFGAYAFIWGTLSSAVRQRAVPTALQGRVGSVYLVGLFGGIWCSVQALGGVIADVWGVAAPFWFAFVGSGVTLLLIWRQLGHIAHADEATQTTA